ncbi:hypothetical protein BC941DRAFT_414866 [Chlamydoabsidia padenii]|nr:hypothetical protein BC941DRAFT_414866 [Chlamydoabsidia padenii]
MQQRQSSCLNCRTRKIKCDRKDPCTRCVKNKNSSCIYPRQGTLGRPPKNAVFHGKVKTNDARKMVIREFIFENVHDLSLTTRHDKNNNNNKTKSIIASGFFIDSEWWILSKKAVQEHSYLNTYFQTIYWFYVKRGLAIRERFDTVTYPLPEKPRLKFNNLQLLYTWWISMSVNLLIKRASKLQLETYSVPSLTLYMFQMNDNYSHMPQYGSSTTATAYPTNTIPPISNTTSSSSIPSLSPKHQHSTQSNPLRSLPPEQAINLINDFFLVHPHAILINKAKLINDYWADTANPLLLSVIYGTTQCFSQILHGAPVLLWESGTETNRNPFLNYAHSLLEILPTTPSVTTYQATVILALFEIIWGYSKVGMSLLATSYLMGTQLGLWDKTFKATDPIEKELVNMTFWSVFRTTTHGCIEMGSSIVDTLVCHQLPFPPMNIHESESYQYDLLHNNINDKQRHAYLIESFYSGSVVTHFSGILYACLPKPYINVYGIKTHDSTFEGSEPLTMLRNIDNVETRVHTVLDDFARFIQQHRHQWSTIQTYTIETSYRLYRIHFRFLQPIYTCGQRKYQEDLIPAAPTFDSATDHHQQQQQEQQKDNMGDHSGFMLDLTDPGIATRLKQSRDDLIALADDLETIIKMSNNDNNNNNNSDGSTAFKSMDRTSLLPHGLQVAAFETCAHLLMLNYQLDPCQHIFDTMVKLQDLEKLQDIILPSPQSMKNVRQQLKTFIKLHQQVSTLKPQHLSSSLDQQQQQQQQQDDDDLLHANSNMLFSLQPVELLKQLNPSISTPLPSSSPHSSISYYEAPLASSPIASTLSSSSSSSIASTSHVAHPPDSYTTHYADIMSMIDSSPSLQTTIQQQKIIHPLPLPPPPPLQSHGHDENQWYRPTNEGQQVWDDASLIDWDSMVVQEVPYELLSFLNQTQSLQGQMPF